MSEKKSFTDKLTDGINKIAAPLCKLSELPEVSAVVDGLVNLMPVIIVGSIFMILYVLGSPSVGSSGKALLPFLTPLAYKFVGVNSVTIGFLSLYATITISINYAKKLGVDQVRGCLIALVTYFLFNIDVMAALGGSIPTSVFSATNLVICMIVTMISVRIYWFCVTRNIVIKMPEEVPPNVGKSFGAIIPFAISFAVAWLIRSVIGFDANAWMLSIFKPISSSADNIFVFSGTATLAGALWSVGIHGDNLLVPFADTLGQMWLADNAAAMAAGASVYELPHVGAGMLSAGLYNVATRTTSYLALCVLLLTSRVKYLRSLGKAVLPSTFFNITEPILFGTPIMLNPFLMVPFLLTNLVGSALGYILNSLPFFGRVYTQVPWATPTIISYPLATGDWKVIIIWAILLAVGILIYLPFFRQFEKDSMKQEAAKEE